MRTCSADLFHNRHLHTDASGAAGSAAPSTKTTNAYREDDDSTASTDAPSKKPASTASAADGLVFTIEHALNDFAEEPQWTARGKCVMFSCGHEIELPPRFIHYRVLFLLLASHIILA